MKDLLQELIKVKSTSDNIQGLKDVIEVVKEYFQGFKGEIIEEFECEGKPSIVIHNGKYGDRHFDVILSGHLDVVPGPESTFSPVEKDGRIYGRGTSDMKGVDVAMIEVFREYVSNHNNKKIALMLTTDEEQGGFHGTKYLVEEEKFSADVVFLPDTGDCNWGICTDEKGVLWLKVTANGVAAHGSRPWLGENAIDRLMDFYNDFKSGFAEEYGIAEAEADYRPTMNISKIEGGHASNSVAEKASLLIDIRYPGEFKSKEFALMAKKYMSSQMNLEILLEGAANSTSADNVYVKRWCEVLQSHNISTRLYKSSGASDGRYFSAKGMPVLMCKPKCSDPHVDNEWIDMEDLERFRDVILEWLVI